MMPHRARLWAIVILTVLDIAALIAAQYVDPALLGQIEPLVTPVLGAVLPIFSVALADAVMVERARRDPSRPAISDDVRESVSLPQGPSCLPDGRWVLNRVPNMIGYYPTREAAQAAWDAAREDGDES